MTISHSGLLFGATLYNRY